MTQFSSQFLIGAVTAAIAVSAVGCTGSVEGTGMTPPGGGGSTGDPGMTGMPGGMTGPTDMPANGDQPAAHMHRLTASQFANSVRDLLGAGVPIGAVDPDQATNGFVSIGSSAIVTSASGINLYEAAAEAASTWLFADPARASAALACVPQAATDTMCASQAIAALGRRAYRRPLTATRPIAWSCWRQRWPARRAGP